MAAAEFAFLSPRLANNGAAAYKENRRRSARDKGTTRRCKQARANEIIDIERR